MITIVTKRQELGADGNGSFRNGGRRLLASLASRNRQSLFKNGRPGHDTIRDHILLTELREAHRACGRSHASLAAKLDINPQMIERLEAGVGSVSMLVDAMAALDFQLIGIGPGRALGDELRDRHQKKALSQEKVAKRTGLLRATIASFECGHGSVRNLLRRSAVNAD